MDYTDEIKRLRAKADELEEAQKEHNLKSEDIRLAEYIHSKTCRSNHTDGCGWGYESWDGSTPSGNRTRSRYLEKARTILKDVDFESAINVIKNI